MDKTLIFCDFPPGYQDNYQSVQVIDFNSLKGKMPDVPIYYVSWETFIPSDLNKYHDTCNKIEKDSTQLLTPEILESLSKSELGKITFDMFAKGNGNSEYLKNVQGILTSELSQVLDNQGIKKLVPTSNIETDKSVVSHRINFLNHLFQCRKLQKKFNCELEQMQLLISIDDLYYLVAGNCWFPPLPNSHFNPEIKHQK